MGVYHNLQALKAEKPINIQLFKNQGKERETLPYNIYF